jgi:hypothetical protein
MKKIDRLLFISTEPVPLLGDTCVPLFFQIRDDRHDVASDAQ